MNRPPKKPHHPRGTLGEQLQAVMLQTGGKLTSLDQTQKWPRKRNNRSNGDISTTPPEGDKPMETPFVNQTSIPAQPTVTVPPPAGGYAEAQVGAVFVEMLRKAGMKVEGIKPKPWTDKVIDAAIPSVIYAIATVGAYAAFTLIENRFANKADSRKIQLATGAVAAPPMLGNKH